MFEPTWAGVQTGIILVKWRSKKAIGSAFFEVILLRELIKLKTFHKFPGRYRNDFGTLPNGTFLVKLFKDPRIFKLVVLQGCSRTLSGLSEENAEHARALFLSELDDIWVEFEPVLIGFFYSKRKHSHVQCPQSEERILLNLHNYYEWWLWIISNADIFRTQKNHGFCFVILFKLV